jgi:protein-ribulosamine 3-kinase
LINPIPSIPLTNEPLRTPLEHTVSDHIGRKWAITQARDMAEFASHPAAILSDGSYAVFAKFSAASNGMEQFEIELAGLRFLSDHSGVQIPNPVGIVPVPGGSILVLEAVQAVDRTPRHWRQIGQTLARLHKVKGNRFGFSCHGYFGPLYQDNTPADDWPTFYAECRLGPMLRQAVDSGNMPVECIPEVERLIARLPDLCGPTVVPSLLHGDASQNNFISTEKEALVIDPAVYFGHPEMDLAYLDYFQPVPQDVFDGYREEMPIDPGFWERRDLWRVWGYLAVITVEGPQHAFRLIETIRKYS